MFTFILHVLKINRKCLRMILRDFKWDILCRQHNSCIMSINLYNMYQCNSNKKRSASASLWSSYNDWENIYKNMLPCCFRAVCTIGTVFTRVLITEVFPYYFPQQHLQWLWAVRRYDNISHAVSVYSRTVGAVKLWMSKSGCTFVKCSDGLNLHVFLQLNRDLLC